MSKSSTRQPQPATSRRLIDEAMCEADGLPPEASVMVPPPDCLPAYVITRELHRGAQGVVYEGIHRASTRRVAIKFMREGPFAEPAEKARFEREVRILGQLKHPNIVTAHDSGEVLGHFYYVMDYIPGQPLDLWMSPARASVKQSLELFVKICEAVSVAHLNGVIHRDLKPGNIRVNSDSQPHILDFGLAKLLPGQRHDGSQRALTITGQFLGSLPWASPEQARGNPQQIDIRSDVYSLGVILYQMLTRRFPYAVAGSMHDVLDNILRSDPIKPSTICRQINNEVETILLKCLRKEPARRYQSAGELARDIRHYLAGEPIQAKRDSVWYVLNKLFHKHRFKVGAALFTVGAVAAAGLLGRQQQAAQQADHLVAAGLELQKQQRFSEAQAKYDQALRLVPNLYQAIGYKAYLLKEEYFTKPYNFTQPDQLAEAMRLCDQALSIKPDSHGLWNLRCVLLYSTGALPHAEQACLKAIELKPDYFYASSNLAKVLALQHRFEDAVAVLDDAVEFAADKHNREIHDDGFWRTLGALQLYLGRTEAANSLRIARDIHTRDTRNWLLLARLHLTLPEHIDAELALDEAKQAQAFTTLQDPRFSRVLAHTLLVNGAFEDAGTHARAAIEGGDQPAYNHLICALANAQLGNHARAWDQLALAESCWPESLLSDEVIVVAEKGLLWLDTLAELEALRDQTTELLSVD